MIDSLGPWHPTETDASLAEHPCFDRCYRIYRNALLNWHKSGAIQSAARTLGMSCRSYCDAMLTEEQFQWTDSTTMVGPFTREHADRAYRLAVEHVFPHTDAKDNS